MISDATIRRVQQMLAAGELSQRQIARECGVSRGSVLRIAGGAHPRTDGWTGRRRNGELSPAVRCRGCGNQVIKLPCLICQARRFKAGTIAAEQLRRTDCQSVLRAS